MTLKDGDVIEFDYDMWVEGHEGLYDTTQRSVAEAAGIAADPQVVYTPVYHIIGSGRLIPGLEEALKDATPGKETEVDVPADKAYGSRDAKLIETLPMAEFKKNDVEPRVGLTLSFKNRRGVVTTVGGGRVRVDFNPPLAGKALKYKFTVRRVAKDDNERLAFLLRMHYPAKIDWSVSSTTVDGKKTAVVDVPEGVVFQERWMQSKVRCILDARRCTPFEQIRFIETFGLLPAETKAAAEAPAA